MLTSSNHDMCVAPCLQSVVATPSIRRNCNVVRKVKQAWKPKQVRQVWKPTGKVLTTISPQCRTDRPLVFGFRLLKTYDGGSLTAYEFREKFIGTVRFRNDHFGAIMGYEDYVIGNSVISRVYYMEGLGHNLFYVGQFCDSDQEVAFRKHSYYVRDTDGVELIKGSRGSILYTISIKDMMKSSPICLLSKASKNKSWLWHRRVNSCPNASGSQPKSHVKPNRISPAKGVNKLPVENQPRTNKSHLRTLNRVDSSSRLKRTVVQIVLWYLDSGCSKHMMRDRSRLMNFVKKFIGTVRFGNDHFGSIMGYEDYVIGNSVISRSKKHTHKPKAENTNLEVLNTLCMDLCGPMRVQTINGKKYILVIVDDYSRFTWVKVLRSKDETLDVVIKFITQIQVGLNRTVRYVRTDNGTEFVNHTMTEYYERIEAVATACYTQNRSLIHTRHHKTPYELVHNKKPDLTFFRVFGALCYPTNDSEDLGKLQPTDDTGIFVGYAPSRKGYRIYNKRTQQIMEIIHVQFDELTEPMAHVHL
nr:integrase, catalytic region, zinc finger, CCHC-type, peptidase aspartic, catalytic [Tanacetum cinerariifolium]